MSRPQIKACIFDMDGLLIDSERVYTIVTNEFLAPYGKQMTWEIKKGIMGRPGLDAARYLVEQTGIPVDPEYCMKAMEARQEELFRKVTPLPGAMKLVAYLATHNIPIAIATGSRQKNFVLKTTHLPELFAHFPSASIITADTENLKRGKPHPDIFLLAAETLNLTATEDHQKCLVFEDGIPGVKAARAANMEVVWVPVPEILDAAKNGEEDIEAMASQTLASLEDFKPEEWGLPAYDEA